MITSREMAELLNEKSWLTNHPAVIDRVSEALDACGWPNESREDTCATCTFYGHEGVGACRRFPPARDGHMNVSANGWCGEWAKS